MYDETLTEAFLKTVASLLQYASAERRAPQASEVRAGPDSPPPPGQPRRRRRKPRAVVAVEKRWCFTLRDMDSRAPAFEHFLSLVADVGTAVDEQTVATGRASSEASGHGEIAAAPLPPGKLLRARRLDVGSLPQRLRGHDRGPDMELWELWL